MEILIGADPEFFVKDEKGKYVSAYGLVSGTKKNPLPVSNGAVQVDGMALEFNINPAKNVDEFVGNIGSVLHDLRNMIPSNLTFEFDPVAEFGKKLIDEQPLEAKELGCDPDFNAYLNGAPNPRPDANTDFRTASGHIHIGWTNGEDVTNPDHLEACMMVTKQLDVALGITEFAWCEKNKRKDLYGKLGTFRPKHYGVEYRVLSNAWLRSTNLQKLIYNVAYSAVQSLYNGRVYYSKNWTIKHINSLRIGDVPYSYYLNYLAPEVYKIWTQKEITPVEDSFSQYFYYKQPSTKLLK